MQSVFWPTDEFDHIIAAYSTLTLEQTMFRFLGFAVFVLTMCPWYSSTHAAFVDLGIGAIYDSTRNITWTQDVRYDEVDLLSNPRIFSLYGTTIVNSDGSTHIVNDVDVYQVPGVPAFRVGGTWWGATAWATTLSFSGVSGWRLPTEAELVGVVADPSYRNVFSRPAFGTLSYLMWTGTEVGADSVTQVQTIPFGNPTYYSNLVAKQLDQSRSFIQVAWAVHPGNILAAPVPEPSICVLIGGGLISILSLNRRAR